MEIYIFYILDLLCCELTNPKAIEAVVHFQNFPQMFLVNDMCYLYDRSVPVQRKHCSVSECCFCLL